jgi:predicted transcriptional regulator
MQHEVMHCRPGTVPKVVFGTVPDHNDNHDIFAVMADSKALKTLMERAASWPDEAQAELVRFMIDTEAKYFGVYRLSDEERAAVRKGIEAAERGEFASNEEIAALFRRCRT